LSRGTDIVVAIDDRIASADLAVCHRALLKEGILHLVEVLVEARVIDIEGSVDIRPQFVSHS
jgi:hypothetical protein